MQRCTGLLFRPCVTMLDSEAVCNKFRLCCTGARLASRTYNRPFVCYRSKLPASFGCIFIRRTRTFTGEKVRGCRLCHAATC